VFVFFSNLRRYIVVDTATGLQGGPLTTTVEKVEVVYTSVRPDDATAGKLALHQGLPIIPILG